MSVGPLVVEIICTFCLVASLLYKYGNWSKHHVMVTLSVLIAWYFSFIIIFILPLDVSSTVYRQCLKDHEVLAPTLPTPLTLITSPTTFTSTLGPSPPSPPPIRTNSRSDNGSDGGAFVSPAMANITILPGLTSAVNSTERTLFVDRSPNLQQGEEVACKEPWSYIPGRVLALLWRVVYWSSQFLTWIILPMMQSYSQAGNFTVMGKLRSAIIDNAIYYGTYLLIFGILLVYIAASPDLRLDGLQLKVICVTTSNTWGLFLLVLLLGYGLVEVPRSCWNGAKRGFMLNYTYFKASKLSAEKSEVDDAVEDILEDLQRISASVRPTHPLRRNVDTILSKVPESMTGLLNSRNSNPGEDTFEYPSERSLTRLHKQLIRTLRIHHRTHTQWQMLVENAISLEDVARNEVSTERYFKPSFQTLQPMWWRSIYTPTIEWYWKCVVRGWILRCLGVILTVFTVFVVWSEVTFFNKSPALSIFAVFVDLAKENYNYFHIEVVSCMTIAYLCVCAYYTIFKIRVLNYYYLAPYHQTDEYSLIFSGMLLCRLTPPLCLNFLGLVHLDSHITSNHDLVETSYTGIMGHMDVISFISDGFNIYFPIGVLVLCLATYFRVGSRFLHLIGFQQFIGDDEMTTDLVEEGRELIKREKRKRQRAEEGETRRRQFQEKLTGSAMYRTPRQRERIPEEKGSGLKREDSTESARAELLRDVEPIDYTGDGGGDLFGGGPAHQQRSTTTNSDNQDVLGRSYQAEGDWTTWSSYGGSRRVPSFNPTHPPRGIFDDV